MMNIERFRKWLRPKAPQATIVSEAKQCAVGVRPEQKTEDECADESSPGCKGTDRIDSQGKKVLMPDIYGDQHVATEPDLKILDQSSPDIEKSSGFNPYDTAVFCKKVRL